MRPELLVKNVKALNTLGRGILGANEREWA